MIDGMPWWVLAILAVVVIAYVWLWMDELRRK